MDKKPHEPFIRRFLSSGDIARYCETSVKQVNRWILNGDLEAFRNPGGHYRITRENFRLFLERNGMPVVEEFFQVPRKRTIVVADDDVKLADMISDVIQSHFDDVDIRTVYDGYEALIAVGNVLPDLVILDIKMPKINGLEVCRKLRSNDTISKDMKILVMTAHSEAYDRDSVITAGADKYLLKPVDKKTLLNTVENLL